MAKYRIDKALVTASYLKEPDDWGKYSLRIILPVKMQERLEKDLEDTLDEFEMSVEDLTYPVSEFALKIINEGSEDPLVAEGEPTIKFSTKDRRTFDNSLLIGDFARVMFETYPYDFTTDDGKQLRGVSFRLHGAKKITN